MPNRRRDLNGDEADELVLSLRRRDRGNSPAVMSHLQPTRTFSMSATS